MVLAASAKWVMVAAAGWAHGAHAGHACWRTRIPGAPAMFTAGSQESTELAGLLTQLVWCIRCTSQGER